MNGQFRSAAQQPAGGQQQGGRDPLDKATDAEAWSVGGADSIVLRFRLHSANALTQEHGNYMLKVVLRVAHHGREALLELVHQFFLRRVHFDVGQRAFGVPVGEGIGEALLPRRHLLPTKHIE